MKVLTAEDCVEMRSLLSSVLTSSGVTVETAEDGKQAISLK
jgi:CheY-like chemotaxis protein